MELSSTALFSVFVDLFNTLSSKLPRALDLLTGELGAVSGWSLTATLGNQRALLSASSMTYQQQSARRETSIVSSSMGESFVWTLLTTFRRATEKVERIAFVHLHKQRLGCQQRRRRPESTSQRWSQDLFGSWQMLQGSKSADGPLGLQMEMGRARREEDQKHG